MNKIGIYTLHHNASETFIYNLNTDQTEIILGGSYPYGFEIMNSSDRTYIDAVDKSIRFDGGGIGSINSHDNNIHTRTSSRSIYN
ncbi:MAG: hypothetical protein KAF91_16660 [Nostoc sp. TH1S01]|nr:hypothetical protein [Nostoc sp. TH1S01]